MAQPVLLLVDGHSLAFRAYYAFALSKQGPLRTAAGIPTSVCFGFVNILMQVIAEEQPTAVAIAFDRGEPTFRHEADVTYKAGRAETPEEFIPDLANLQDLLPALGLTVMSLPGYEADDLLGTLAERGAQGGYRVKILSGDRDLFQLVDSDRQISVLYLEGRAARGGQALYRTFDPAAVREKMGVWPAQVVDYKALCGDKSDNIPGVRGIGEKTAAKLLATYETLDRLWEVLPQLAPAVGKKLREGKEAALHSRFLAEIKRDVPLDLTPADCTLRGFERAVARSQLQGLELNKFLQTLDQWQSLLGGEEVTPPETPLAPPAVADHGQLSLFPGDRPAPSPTQHLAGVQPWMITSEGDLARFGEKLAQWTADHHPVAWDTETTGLDIWTAQLVGIGCAWGPHPEDTAYIPLHHCEGEQLSADRLWEVLRSYLENPLAPKVLQNAKFDRQVLWRQGIDLRGVVLDTMLASYVLRPEGNHNLTDLSLRYLDGVVPLHYGDLGIPKGQNLGDLPIATAAAYCALDCYATWLLREPLERELVQVPDLAKLLRAVEQPLEPVLARMEYQGIRINRPYLESLSQTLGEDLQALETQVYTQAGQSFNLSSPKQLGEILFETLGLDVKKTRKTKTGYSTNHAVLEKLQGDHPIIEAILSHRTLSKLKSTYGDALPTLINPQTDRIHTDFNQAVTATGRLSSSNPNLQNIPIRTEFSRRIRQAFLPEKDWLLVSADYSQIELRILAHLSQEPVLVQAYQQGEDVHRVTAQLLFDHDDLSQVTPEERRLGKIINFGVIYGMGSQRFARESGLGTTIAKEFIQRYHQRYPQVFHYLETVKKKAIAQGYITTLLGRRRYFQFASTSLKQLRGGSPQAIDLEALDYGYEDGQLLRAAANAAIQGSSADLIKVAMVHLDGILASYQGRLLLQVHDELVLEIPPEEWEDLQPQIRHTMEQAIALSVPLVVDIHAGSNWMETKV